jgi:heat shock protein HtpX
VYDQVAQNKRRSYLLILGFVGLVLAVGAAINLLVGGGPAFMLIALVIAAVSAAFSYWKSDAIALRVSRARPASVEEYGRLHNLVEGLCIAGGLPKPRLYVIDDPSPNAFATGRDPKHAAVAVTTGLLERMNRVELEGVLAHELSHIKNYDILVSTLAVTMVGVIAIAADLGIRFLWFGMGRSRNNSGDGNGGGGLGIVFAILGFGLLLLSPLIGRAMQAAVSRRRETLADVSGIELTRYPPGLISALEKLRDDYTVVGSTSHATAHLWIEQPQAVEEHQGRISRINRMFDTHPPLEERIALLREL